MKNGLYVHSGGLNIPVALGIHLATVIHDF